MIQLSKREVEEIKDPELRQVIKQSIEERRNKPLSFTQDEINSIWDQAISSDGTPKGYPKLNLIKLADLLKFKIRFITLGNEKFSIYYYENGIYKPTGEKRIIQLCNTLTKGSIKISEINEVISKIRSSTFKERSILNSTPKELICVENGILNIVTKELLPHDPDVIFTHKIPIEYDPLVTCDKFQKWLSEVYNEIDIPLIQEWYGYTLWRDYPFKKAIIHVGGGDTGKTTALKIHMKFIGEDNVSGISLHSIVTDRFAGASMEHKLLNVYDDLDFKDLKATGSFKIATGNGWLSAEKKFGENYMFKNYAKLSFATNKIASVSDTEDYAYYGRWLIIFYNNPFLTNVKKNIVEELTTPEELSGILNWALEGLTRLMLNGNFTYSRTPEENKLIMECNSNSLSRFISTCLKNEGGIYISKEDLYFIYSVWVSKNGGDRFSKEKFGRDLPTKAPYILDVRKDTKHKTSDTCWANVSLNNDALPYVDYAYDKGIIYINSIKTNKLEVVGDEKKCPQCGMLYPLNFEFKEGICILCAKPIDEEFIRE